MFGRYAIAFGRGSHRHTLESRAQAMLLPVRHRTRELLLVAMPDTICLSGRNAILVGQMFTGTKDRQRSLPPGIGDQADISAIAPALRGHWGNFALFWASQDKAAAYREPSGSVGVYRCGRQDQAIFVSDAALAAQLGLLDRPEIDSNFLVHWLQFPFLRTARTGLEGVTELLPGMLLGRTGGGDWRESRIWHPSTFVCRSYMIEDAREADALLRETALSVVAAQATADNMVLRLSGGLDSSVIAACLSEAGITLSSINFATRARDGDERAYAREVAEHFGFPLVEVTESAPASLGPPARPSFRPLTNPLLEPYDRAISQAAGDLRATLLIDGAGGDNLFCSVASAAPVLDALAWSSPGAASRAVTDIAERAGCTIWEVLRAAARRRLRRRSAWTEDRSFLVRDALLRAPELHPWLQDLVAPPGKREHVEAIVHVHHFLDRSVSPAAALHPLLAQPLLEICLSIPSWLWVRGGRDRAVARNAFAGLVPRSVLERRLKGSLQSLLYRSFAQLRDEMRDLLDGGELASAGLIDAAAVSGALDGDAWTEDAVQLRISEMVALESWIRFWRSTPSAASIAA